jgi:hypothetical protein
MELPPGAVDPIFMAELALELKMSVGEMAHGRGTPMSAHELCVFWPAYFRHVETQRELDEQKGS